MATNTPNYNFDLREGTDIFNPLSSNANWESLDTLLKTIQETGGITTYTTTASANLLKLSGTPKVNDTVFKFVAAGNANTWTAATGGVVNNIVGLDGAQMTIQGGNMYIAWINSANSMVCVVWPEVVNAQTFDGKGPAEWATKVQLDAVNTTAANATQTAQAAATVANQALEKAKDSINKKILTSDIAGNDTSNSLIGNIGTSIYICSYQCKDSNNMQSMPLDFGLRNTLYFYDVENARLYRRWISISGSTNNATLTVQATQYWNGTAWTTSADSEILKISSIYTLVLA